MKIIKESEKVVFPLRF